MTKKTPWPLAAIKRYKISELKLFPNMLEGEKCTPRKDDRNQIFYHKNDKERLPFQTTPHKMALSNILSRSRRWDEVSSCKEP